MPELVTQSDFAKMHGVVAGAVSNWKKQNLLVFATDARNPRRQLVDVERSNLLLKGMLDPTRGRPTAASQKAPAPTTPSFDAPPASGTGFDFEMQRERLRAIQAQTSRRELENDKLAGELVAVAEFERRAGDLGRQTRERIQSAFRQNSERLAAESDPRAVQALCLELIDQTFEALASEIEAEARIETEIDQALASVDETDPMLDLDTSDAA